MTGKVAVVTGAGRGIGLSIAEVLCKGGMAVAIMEVDPDRGRAAVRSLRQNGGTATSFAGDVTQRADVDRVVAGAERAFGPIDVLVNNVGIFIPEPTRAEDVDFGAWRRIIDTNVNGTFLVSQRVGRSMIERGLGGAIVNIASIYGVRSLDWRLYGPGRRPPRFDDASYHVSKAAVIQLTRSLAVSWADFGIRVNSVSPGVIDTEANREVLQSVTFRKIAGRVPAGRWGQPSEIAEAVAFLASDRAAYITGANLVVDGGWICW